MSGAVLRAVLAARATWWAPGLIAALTSLLIGVCLVQATATGGIRQQRILAAAGLEAQDVAGVGVSITMIIVPTATIVLAAVTAAAVGQTTRDLARWRLIGASPAVLSAFVLGQLVLVVCVGAVLGSGLTAAAGGQAARILNAMVLPELAGVAVRPTSTALLGALLGPVGIAAVAGLPGALRASRVPPVRAVHGEEETPRAAGVGRWILAGLGLLALGLAMGAALRSPAGLADGGAFSVGLGLGLLVLVVAGCGARVLVPALVSAWTAVFALPRAEWVIARAGAVARARAGGATVVALACGVGMLGILTGMARTAEAIERAMGSAREYNLLDVYVICGAVGLLCAAGGACVLALGAVDRRREVAQLRAVGCSPAQILALAACEALILSVTSLLLAGLATALAVGAVLRAATADGLPLRPVLPLAELGLGGLMTALVLLAVLLLPTLGALRTSVRTSLAAR